MAKLSRFLLENSDALAVFVALGGWRFLTSTPLTVRTACTVLGLYVVLGVVIRVRATYEWAFANGADKGAPKDETRVFVENPNVVLELAKLTGFEAIKRLTPYLGKWMTISGRFEGIAESLQKDSIHLSLLLNDGQRINLRFAMDHAEALRAVQVGQRITVTGQIPTSGSALIPENCEIVRIEPLRAASRLPLRFLAGTTPLSRARTQNSAP